MDSVEIVDIVRRNPGNKFYFDIKIDDQYYTTVDIYCFMEWFYYDELLLDFTMRSDENELIGQWLCQWISRKKSHL